LAPIPVFDPADIVNTLSVLPWAFGKSIHGIDAKAVVGPDLGNFSSGGSFLTSSASGTPGSTSYLQRSPRREANWFTAPAGSGSGNGSSVYRQVSPVGCWRRPSGVELPGGAVSLTRFGYYAPGGTVPVRNRFFCGYTSNSGLNIGLVDGTFDAMPNVWGVGKDDLDTNIQFITNDAAGNITKVDTGIAYSEAGAANKLLYLYCYTAWQSDLVRLILLLKDTGVSVSQDFTTNLSARDTDMMFHYSMNEGFHVNANNVQTNTCILDHFRFADI
jgi:hypothetical protein